MEQTVFSVIVAGFLLVRMERTIKRLETAILLLRHCKFCVYGSDFAEEETASEDKPAVL